MRNRLVDLGRAWSFGHSQHKGKTMDGVDIHKNCDEREGKLQAENEKLSADLTAWRYSRAVS